ncbi:MAG TPA: zf-HC2 domain-containing protein [Pyrinomonadaceae bacterium]|nr:zf-HC2 domain-containing protein [Pyrinomonadaceae bacterium]
MSCEEIQQELSLYVDDELTEPARAACDAHIEVCPVCREELAQLRLMTRGLAQLARPVPPLELIPAITDALIIEAAARRRSPHNPLHIAVLQWIEPRLMPYTVGSFASVILFLVLISAFRPHMQALRDWEVSQRDADVIALRVFATQSATGEDYDISQPVTAENYAARRAPYSTESPSLNPRGSLAGLVWSPLHGHDRTGDDDMVVLTDVFWDGQASLAGVVQAPRDPRMLEEFQNALRRDAAFVPASYDRRPETLRVVLFVQKVSVHERKF